MDNGDNNCHDNDCDQENVATPRGVGFTFESAKSSCLGVEVPEYLVDDGDGDGDGDDDGDGGENL